MSGSLDDVSALMSTSSISDYMPPRDGVSHNEVVLDSPVEASSSPLKTEDSPPGSSEEKSKDERLLWRTDSWREGAPGGDPMTMTPKVRQDRLEQAFRTILECVGEDPTRDGLVDTPARAAKSILFLTKGYEENVDSVVKHARFEEDWNELVSVKDIDFYSLCEHHLIPFYGKVHIGYIPTGKVLGLSKLARISEMFARRFQNQERMTKQIAGAVIDAIRPSGVGVIVEGTHMCMCMRGVQKAGAITTTSTMLGTFLDDPRTRDEFLRICGKK